MFFISCYASLWILLVSSKCLVANLAWAQHGTIIIEDLHHMGRTEKSTSGRLLIRVMSLRCWWHFGYFQENYSSKSCFFTESYYEHCKFSSETYDDFCWEKVAKIKYLDTNRMCAHSFISVFRVGGRAVGPGDPNLPLLAHIWVDSKASQLRQIEGPKDPFGQFEVLGAPNQIALLKWPFGNLRRREAILEAAEAWNRDRTIGQRFKTCQFVPVRGRTRKVVLHQYKSEHSS